MTCIGPARSVVTALLLLTLEQGEPQTRFMQEHDTRLGGRVGNEAGYRGSRYGTDEDPSGLPEAGSIRGGVELLASATVRSLFAKTATGGLLEASYRTAGSEASRQGHFSIGVQLQLTPSVGTSREFQYEIGHITQLNLNVPAGSEATVRFGSVDLHEHELFLARPTGAPVYLQGMLSISPSGSDVFEVVTYRMSNV